MLGDLNELKTFRAILETGSLTAAARDLGVGLGVVSKRLQSLERRTAVRLINRTTRSLSPTEAGARLFQDVVQALDALASAQDYLSKGRSEPAGLLRVSAPVSLGRRHIAPILGALTERYPALSVSLTLEDRVADLVGEGLDLAIRVGGLTESSAVMRKLGDSRRILVASPAYLAANGHPRDPAALLKHRLLRKYGDAEPWLLTDRHGRKEVINAKSRLIANSGEALADWAIAGLGIAYRSDCDLADALATGTLVRLLPEWSGPIRPVIALYPSGRDLPLKTRTALDALAEELIPRLLVPAFTMDE
ncbi:LysR family transcriptional regulator [Novosphingobium terrae]|uniref:LysR family transcriptional regulator n=1 Tax=Novosphingobium terrae TaxID=2726189 RepID=UPI00197D71CC|nr:LysR family transcriptional regulator [Novosphingobium terrae]